MPNDKTFFNQETEQLNKLISDVIVLNEHIDKIYENVKETLINAVNDREGEPEISERGLALDELYTKMDNALSIIRNFRTAATNAQQKLEKL